MVAELLQDDLCEELNRLFEQDIFKNPYNERQKLTAYPQDLPIPDTADIQDNTEIDEEGLGLSISDRDKDDQFFPYVIVRAEEGSIKEAEADQEVNITLLFGAWDDDKKNQGHRHILHMIQKVYERFAKFPILADRYECELPIEWATQDEPSWPYFFGGMNLKFRLLGIRREDPNT